MKSPIDLLKHRLAELVNEYNRVANVPLGGQVNNLVFMHGTASDLFKIKTLITDYEKSIKLLTELSEL